MIIVLLCFDNKSLEGSMKLEIFERSLYPKLDARRLIRKKKIFAKKNYLGCILPSKSKFLVSKNLSAIEIEPDIFRLTTLVPIKFMVSGRPEPVGTAYIVSTNMEDFL